MSLDGWRGTKVAVLLGTQDCALIDQYSALKVYFEPWFEEKGRRRINKLRGKSFSIRRSGSLLDQSCMSVLIQKQRGGPI